MRIEFGAIPDVYPARTKAGCPTKILLGTGSQIHFLASQAAKVKASPWIPGMELERFPD
jgi:hypothetical protein